MFRKSIIAIAAVVTIAAVALPSAASAKKWRGGHHHFRSFAGVTVLGTGLVASSCYKYRWVETRRGLRKVLVNVCNYY